MFGTGLSDPRRPSVVADTEPKNILDVCSVDGIVAKLMAALYGNTDEFLASVGTIRCAIAKHWWRFCQRFCRYRACIFANDRMIRGVSNNFGRSPLHHGCAFAILRVRGSLDPCVLCCSVSMDDDLPKSECKQHDTEVTVFGCSSSTGHAAASLATGHDVALPAAAIPATGHDAADVDVPAIAELAVSEGADRLSADLCAYVDIWKCWLARRQSRMRVILG